MSTNTFISIMCLLWKTNASITFWLPASNNYLQIGTTTYQLINSQQWLMPSTTSSPKSQWNHFCPQAFTKAESVSNICLGSSYHCLCNSVEKCAKWKLSHTDYGSVQCCETCTVCPTHYRTPHFFNNSITNEDNAMVATSSTCYDVVTFLTQWGKSASNFVAISSLVIKLLKKCRVRKWVGHTVFLHNNMWSVILLWSVKENFASSFLGSQFQAE